MGQLVHTTACCQSAGVCTHAFFPCLRANALPRSVDCVTVNGVYERVQHVL